MSEINEIKEVPEGTFPIDLKLIHRYQLAEPSLMDKYEDGTYHKGSFCGDIYEYLSLVTCKDKIVAPSKLQSYVLHWYHTYLLHPGMCRTEAMIYQHLYWPIIIYSVYKEVTNCETCQRPKLSKNKYGKLPANLFE